jgi:hypothetical protein
MKQAKKNLQETIDKIDKMDSPEIAAKLAGPQQTCR